MAIDGSALFSMIKEELQEHKASLVKEVQQLREENASKIHDLVKGQVSFAEEMLKIRAVEARLQKAEQEIRTYQIQAAIDNVQRDLIMPRLETTNRSEVFAAVQKKLGKVSDALGFFPTLIGVRPMGLAISCLNFPSSIMRDKALSAFRQATPPPPYQLLPQRFSGTPSVQPKHISSKPRNPRGLSPISLTSWR